jgi:hypothetical protein
MTGPARYLFAGLVGACVLLGIVLVAMTPARGHSDGAMTYDPDCCHNMDCAPVDKVEVLPSGSIASMLVPPAHAAPSVMIVTTKHGTVAVPTDFPMRSSKDSRMHACIRQGKLVCLYMPPGT